jgi:hypothetical protein
MHPSLVLRVYAGGNVLNSKINFNVSFFFQFQ